MSDHSNNKMREILMRPHLLKILLQQRALSGFFQRERTDQHTMYFRDPKEGFKEYDELFRKAQDLAERMKKEETVVKEIQELSKEFERLTDEYDIENDFFYWPNNTK